MELLFDEEDEIKDIVIHLEDSKIKYKIISNISTNNYKTRKEKETSKIIIQKLSNLYKNKETNKLQYLYLECFNKTENDINKIYNVLKKEINNNTKKQYTIYNIFKLIETK